ncbi:expressed unknown protein [Seminavis robusta]|uniref:Uncharacterized protein n=1 Tax=Seminavis robusta TaxID=568900 RepID=A0A9N8DTB7_9STRA|nr:expressed unknown protein [Seminavis robusta]|eukprot:Sro263_g102250.1 n/a (460) ;mRNA; f:35638-37017
MAQTRSVSISVFLLVIASVCTVPVLVLVHTKTSSLRGNGDRGIVDAEDTKRPSSEGSGTQRKLLSMELDYEFVQRANLAHYLSKLMKRNTLLDEIDYWNDYYQSFMAWDFLGHDRAMVVKKDDVCYTHFKAQSRNSLIDIWQTLNPLVQRNAYGTGCDVRKSYYNAYEAPYQDEMKAETDRCVKSCENGDCPLILCGTSTGGASAMVAALDPFMQKYDPLVIVTGPLRALISDECDALDTDRIYRITTANAGYYDAASDGSPKMGRHFGHHIMLDEMSNPFYIGPDDSTLRQPDNYNIHIVEAYINRLQALADRPASDYPMTLEQFPDGHWCTLSDECNSGHCQLDDPLLEGVCSELGGGAADVSRDDVLLAVGSICSNADECATGMCVLGRCAMEDGLLAVGSYCEEHENCATDKCVDNFCMDKTGEGSWCRNDWECASNLCAGRLSWIMMRRCAADP